MKEKSDPFSRIARGNLVNERDFGQKRETAVKATTAIFLATTALDGFKEKPVVGEIGQAAQVVRLFRRKRTNVGVNRRVVDDLARLINLFDPLFGTHPVGVAVKVHNRPLTVIAVPRQLLAVGTNVAVMRSPLLRRFGKRTKFRHGGLEISTLTQNPVLIHAEIRITSGTIERAFTHQVEQVIAKMILAKRLPAKAMKNIRTNLVPHATNLSGQPVPDNPSLALELIVHQTQIHPRLLFHELVGERNIVRRKLKQTTRLLTILPMSKAGFAFPPGGTTALHRSAVQTMIRHESVSFGDQSTDMGHLRLVCVSLKNEAKDTSFLVFCQ